MYPRENYQFSASTVHNKREKRVSNMACSVLNVCRESRAWNANYSTTISKHIIVYKHHRTSIQGDMAFQACDSPDAFNAQYRSIRYSLLPFIMYSWMHAQNCMIVCGNFFSLIVAGNDFSRGNLWLSYA